MWNGRATNWVQTINHSLLHATKLRYLISFLLRFWFISSLCNKQRLKCSKCPSTISFFRLLRIFQSLLIQIKSTTLSMLSVALSFSLFFVRFWDYRLSIQFILKRLIKGKFQFICLTTFMFTYEVSCYSLQKKTKRWRL